MAIDSDQLEKLFREKHLVLYAAAMAITRNHASAEDAVHDALIAVAESSAEPANLQAYLYTVVRNKALLSASRARINEVPVEQDFVDFRAVDGSQSVLLRQALAQIEKLDLNTRQVLILKLFADLTFNEIAQLMNEPLNTVASWYRRGLQHVQEKLHE